MNGFLLSGNLQVFKEDLALLVVLDHNTRSNNSCSSDAQFIDRLAGDTSYNALKIL